jgi:hypothetical protein
VYNKNSMPVLYQSLSLRLNTKGRHPSLSFKLRQAPKASRQLRITPITHLTARQRYFKHLISPKVIQVTKIPLVNQAAQTTQITPVNQVTQSNSSHTTPPQVTSSGLAYFRELYHRRYRRRMIFFSTFKTLTLLNL